MKKIIFLFLLLVSSKINATPFSSDSIKQGFFDELSINMMWGEFGVLFPIKENNLNSLPYGMDKYLYNTTRGGIFNFMALSFYYRNKFGIELLLSGTSNVYGDGTSFGSYIS